MARRRRDSVNQVWARVESVFKSIENLHANRRLRMMDGTPTSIDVLFGTWHDMRRLKADIQPYYDIGRSLRDAVNQRAKDEYNDNQYDLQQVADDTIAKASAVQIEIASVLNCDPQGLVGAPYAFCRDAPPFFAQVDPVDYATTAQLLDELLELVTDEV